MFDLAQTAWPRFGGDRANRSLVSIPGPHVLPTWHKIPLPEPSLAHSSEYVLPGNVIVMPDETLRVSYTEMLVAMKLDGTLIWHLDLHGLAAKYGLPWGVGSLPSALASGETLLYFCGAPLTVDRNGNAHWEEPQLTQNNPELPGLSDPATSPNLTYRGLPLISTAPGEVYVFTANQWQELGIYGYDIPMPAMYPDDSLAIAGFDRTGFCRANLDGSFQWKTDLRDADLLPTLNYEYVAAVGSLNDSCSAFFNERGEQIGEYKHAARFAVYPGGGWIALAKQRLARLTLEGKELWGHEINGENPHTAFVEQPLADRDGFVFVRQHNGILCYDPQGRIAFEAKLPAPGLLSIVAPRLLACVVKNELWLGWN